MDHDDPRARGTASAPITGGCLCRAVRYECTATMREVINCHCRMCRKTHGHIAAYTAVAQQDLCVTVSRGLKWYASSDTAQRGFCTDCGASLFWLPAGGDYIAVSAGTLDLPAGLKTVRHVFTADAGEYYEITDSLERFAGSMRT